MATSTLLTEKSPAEQFSLQNRAVLRNATKLYAKVTSPGIVQECYLTLAADSKIDSTKIGLSGLQVQ